MKTVKEVSELTGISIRTLRYYDEIDLLKPAKVTEAGYRLYDESSLKKLRQIMFFRELEVPLSEIKAIMKDSESDNRKILETQKMMREMKRNRLNGIIELISDVLKGEDKMKQTISVLVENQAGVLNRITGLFSRRAFNIESLAVGVTDDPTISRITIIVDSGNNMVEQVEKQLNKLIEVIKVRTLEETNLIGRELMILKVNANNKTRQDIMTICEIMGAKVDDISPTSMTLELSSEPDRLDTFQAMLRPFSILEVARTGVIAVQKGGGKI